MDSSPARGPDPSALTTAQLATASASLEKLFTQRMDAIEKAVEIAHENLVRVPTDVDKAVGHLRSVIDEKLNTHLEKFASVQTQFSERDVRTEQSAIGTKVAVDAALQAAKEAGAKQQEASDKAIAKTETNTTKNIDQQSVLIANMTKALDDKIGDVKERLTLIEGSSKGMTQGWAILLGAIGGLVGLAGIVAYATKI